MPRHSAHRIELLRPHQLRDIIEVAPVAYLPLGTYEWHGEHLPIGLDSLTAHGVCLAAAAKTNGVVLPPLYYGTGGGHGHYPFTIMMASDAQISALVEHSFARLEAFGFRLVVLFTGHFAPTQVEMVHRLAEQWNSKRTALKVLGISINEIPCLALPPDHAALFETTLLYELWPETVDISRLPALEGAPMPESDSFSEARHDPDHPLHGIIGPDPRTFSRENGPWLLEDAVNWLAAQVSNASAHSGRI
ncbi:creatinase [Rhizobium jaguaris]|uniref:Creatinase n=2 Tax=Rhizobium jaguaris TaxID=1312183 RepID=A0A387FZV7_9HYPH|nr:creatinase [Rhizobium jaguaris]